jgi:hypothetical protein
VLRFLVSFRCDLRFSGVISISSSCDEIPFLSMAEEPQLDYRMYRYPNELCNETAI